MKRVVQGVGPTRPGTIVVVGDAPGKEEVDRGVPFVGRAGKILRSKIVQAGLYEKDVRFENVIEYKLEGNDISKLYVDERKQIPNEELANWFRDVRTRISALAPSVVVACGEAALQALTGERGIGKHHCTVAKGIEDAKGIPIIPVYHPTFLLPNRAPEMAPWLIFGLIKAKQIQGGAKDVKRSFEIEPSFDVAVERIRSASSSDRVSIDLETTRNTKEITCFGVSAESSSAICVPLSRAGGSYWTEDQEKQIWIEIAKLCRSENEKIFQNYIFDTMFLSRFGVEVRGRIFDTMLAGHVLQPELRKGLADLARLYTFAPAWKGDQDWSVTVDPRGLWEYNAKDAAITYEIADRQKRELDDFGLRDHYQTCIEPLIPLVYEICSRGWNVDTAALAEVRTQMNDKCIQLKEEIGRLAEPHVGTKFNPNSHTQVKKLYSSLGIDIPVSVKTIDGDKVWKESTDRKSLMKIQKKHPEYEITGKLLEYSKASKLRSTYCNVDLDADGRLRFSVNIAGTKSGRFSSSQTAWGTGFNSQNVPSRDPSSPYNFRHIVIPDDGKVFIQLDLKQAEARVVSWLAGETAMERILDEGGDIHTRVASLIFGSDINSLPDAERKRRRYLGKKSVHAFNYGMAEGTFIDSCLLEADLTISMDEARRLRSAYFDTFREIPRWHNEVKQQVKTTRIINTPYNAQRQFYGRMNDDTFREAMSYLPQHIVANYLNRGWMRIEKDSPIQVIGQCHDSLLMQVEENLLQPALVYINQIFNSLTVEVAGKFRTIPFDITTGKNWRDLK